MSSGLYILQYGMLQYLGSSMIKITQGHMEFTLICVTVTRKKVLNVFLK